MAIPAQHGALSIILFQANGVARFPGGLLLWIKHHPSKVAYNSTSTSSNWSHDPIQPHRSQKMQ